MREVVEQAGRSKAARTLEMVAKAYKEAKAVKSSSTKEEKELKEELLLILGSGEDKIMEVGSVTIIKTTAHAPAPTLDVAELKAKEPALYASLFAKYNKQSAGAVSIEVKDK
jgi:hypothetical protein